jgi:hypothetical protein
MTNLSVTKAEVPNPTDLKVKTGGSSEPLNVITLGQTKIESNNRMITLTGYFYLLFLNKYDA